MIFPPWTNRLPGLLLTAGLAAVLAAAGGYFYYFDAWYTDVGYQPLQPIPFSHKLHAGDLQIDCRYCHTSVEVSPQASIPETRICMNCHRLVARKSEKLAPLRESAETGLPIQWIRVHKLPEFAYFNHAVHLRAGVGCRSCHGDVASMEEIRQTRPLSMGWCLECHRDPVSHLRPLSEITSMTWEPPTDQVRVAAGIIKDKSIDPATDCTTCHR
ncbi:MAG: cytochrome c3 family protein [Acidobacteriota bacterium]